MFQLKLRPKSLQWRLVSIFVLITISLVTFIGVVLNNSVEASYYNTFKESIKLGLENWSLKDKPNPNVEELKSELQDNKRNGYYFSIVGDYRSYSIIERKTCNIVDSSAKKFKRDPSLFRKEILKSENLRDALEGFVGDKGKLTKTDDGSAFFDYATKPVGDYILYFRFEREEWQETINSFNNVIIVSCILAILVSLVLGYILSKTITVPIVDLMHKVKEIASGDFDQVLEVKSDDEIGNLTMAFNYMAKELDKTLGEISSEKSKNEKILNYMTDGVIATNLQGEVIHINPAAKELLGVNGFSCSFNEFLKDNQLGFSLDDIVYLGTTNINEKVININDKFVKFYFAVFTDEDENPEGIIGVLQDITAQQKLDAMRSEFVANVSHELRTPLTSIKSYTETLLDGALEDKETAEKFLNVVNSEADRMTRLVKDLLQLSKIENEQMQWNMKETSIVQIVKRCVDKMQIEAKNSEQILESFTIGDIPEVLADIDRIEQVILNLLSNAIKYTSPGGKITVYIGKLHKEIYIKVSDNGVGIPSEDLSRIFERFYRVDKARSREMGGTGLGLSIAKEIVEAHKGTILIASEYGKGTEVTVKLPICN